MVTFWSSVPPRAFLLCTLGALLVPVIGRAQLRQEILVPGSTASLARVLGFDPAPERSRFMLEPFGRTSLYDAVARSLQILDKRSGKRAVVVFTDGQDVSSQMSLEEIEALVESGNSTLFMIGTEKAIRKDKLRKVLERLSQRSGGRALLDKKLDRLEDAFADVYREIRSQYLLGYLPTNQNFDGGWRSIRLEVLANRLEIRGREGYRAQRR